MWYVLGFSMYSSETLLWRTAIAELLKKLQLQRWFSALWRAKWTSRCRARASTDQVYRRGNRFTTLCLRGLLFPAEIHFACRPNILHRSMPLQYEPEDEAGVIYLPIFCRQWVPSHEGLGRCPHDCLLLAAWPVLLHEAGYR